MTPQEGHIGPYQGTMLVFAILASMLFLQYPLFLIQAAGPAAWQAAIVVTAAGLLLFVPVWALAMRFPGLGLTEISEETAGPVAGPLFSLMLALWFGAGATLTLRNFTETFLTTILPTTPPSVLILTVAACMMYASYRGIESLSRTALILSPLIAGGLLLLLIFEMPLANTSYLFPVWGYGLGTTVRAGVFYAGMTADVLLLLALGRNFRSGASLRTSGVAGILLFGLSAALTVFALLATFGTHDAGQVSFPLFNLARMIHLGRFLQRPEALLVMFWFFAAVVRLAALFHGLVVTLAGSIKVPFYRPLIFPAAAIIVALSLLPEDYMVVLRLERDWVRPAGLLLSAVPPLLLALAYVRNKKGGRSHAV